MSTTPLVTSTVGPVTDTPSKDIGENDYSVVREARARMKHANEMARSKGRPDSFPAEKQ